MWCSLINQPAGSSTNATYLSHNSKPCHKIVQGNSQGAVEVKTRVLCKSTALAKLAIAIKNCKKTLDKCVTQFNCISKSPDFDALFSKLPNSFEHFNQLLGQTPIDIYQNKKYRYLIAISKLIPTGRFFATVVDVDHINSPIHHTNTLLMAL